LFNNRRSAADTLPFFCFFFRGHPIWIRTWMVLCVFKTTFITIFKLHHVIFFWFKKLIYPEKNTYLPQITDIYIIWSSMFFFVLCTLYVASFFRLSIFLLPLRIPAFMGKFKSYNHMMMTAKIVGTETKRYLPTYNAYILTLNLSKQKWQIYLTIPNSKLKIIETTIRKVEDPK
jgi:hypothetical protein